MPEGGAVSLLCLAAGSGLPLFCRPPRPQVPFPVAGALHAALLYGAGAGVGLRGAGSRSGCLAWRGFHRSVTLIALSSEPGACERRLGQLLERAFGTMVSTSTAQYGPVGTSRNRWGPVGTIRVQHKAIGTNINWDKSVESGVTRP